MMISHYQTHVALYFFRGHHVDVYEVQAGLPGSLGKQKNKVNKVLFPEFREDSCGCILFLSIGDGNI